MDDDGITSLVFLCVQHPTAIINQRMAESLRPPAPALQAPRRSTPLPPWIAAPAVTAPVITLSLNQVSVTGAPGIHPELLKKKFTLPFVFFVTDSLLFNRIDERLRLARERRGELEKQNGVYLCSFRNIWWLNLLGRCSEVPISRLHKVLAPLCFHGASVTQYSRLGLGTLFRKASSLACEWMMCELRPSRILQCSGSWSLLCFLLS